MSDALYALVADTISVGQVIETLARKQTNYIAGIDRPGVYVETERSKVRGTGPQHVPAWMIDTAWDHLRRNGELSQVTLLNDLNVKRSAFVCALLARFPGVVVHSDRAVVLRLAQGRNSQMRDGGFGGSFVDFRFAQNPDCPQCGGGRTQQIRYGMPMSPEEWEPWVYMGGCCVGDAKWRCSYCDHRWP